MNTTAHLATVLVGRPRPVAPLLGSEPVPTAIFKEPVSGPVQVGRTNLAGDAQADLENHGGPYKAVYAYAREDLEFWAEQLGRPLPDGSVGENLTTLGLDVTGALVGERWRIGTVLLEVVQPRIPCFKLGIRVGDRHFPRRFGPAARPGAYLRVVAEGQLAAGDRVEVVHRPTHGVSVGLVAHAYFNDRSLAERVLSAPELAPSARASWERIAASNG